MGETNEDDVEFLRTVDLLSGFSFDQLIRGKHQCSVQHYSPGTVVISNSNESQWICIIKEGSCQVFRVTKPPKLRDKKKLQTSREQMDGLSRTSTLPALFPKIRMGHQCLTAGDFAGDASEEGRMPAPRRTISDASTKLPQLCLGNRYLTCQQPSCESPQKSEEEKENKKKSKHAKNENGQLLLVKRDKNDRKKPLPMDPPRTAMPTTYAKLEVLSEKCVFGIQSVIYDDSPSFTLVSNGADCILVSKDFFLQQMDPEMAARLRKKVTQCKSLASIQNSVDAPLHWNVYKETIVRDILR